jgi:hypothetical protein
MESPTESSKRFGADGHLSVFYGNRNLLKNMEAAPGFEPGNNGFAGLGYGAM